MKKLEHCPSNPTLEYAENKAKEFRHEKAILSIGGGSTIDVGKYIAAKWNLYHKAIPTTAGTGSEVTRYCVLTVDGKKTTFLLNRPDEFELDRERIKTLPFLQRLSGRLDAYCQALESTWSPKSTPESIMYAKMALEIIDEDPLLAANYSGRAIDITGTSIVHALSYGLTEKYNIPHGLACGLMMSLFEDINLSIYIDMLKLVDIDSVIDRAFEAQNWSNHYTKYEKYQIKELWEKLVK